MDDKKQFLILRNPVMHTFMNFVKFCYDVGCNCEECRVEKEEEKCSVLNKDYFILPFFTTLMKPKIQQRSSFQLNGSLK